MTPEEAKKFPKYTPNPLFKDMPAYLKNPINFNDIQRVLLDTLKGKHSHSEMITWASCLTCQSKMKDHRMAMKKLGFKSPQQYLAWKKVMDVLINKRRMPIEDKTHPLIK